MLSEQTASRAEWVMANVLRELIGYAGEVTPDLRQEDVPGWDSLAHISIVEELESRFGVRFTTDEMVEMVSLPAIKAVLARRGVMDA